MEGGRHLEHSQGQGEGKWRSQYYDPSSLALESVLSTTCDTFMIKKKKKKPSNGYSQNLEKGQLLVTVEVNRNERASIAHGTW